MSSLLVRVDDVLQQTNVALAAIPPLLSDYLEDLSRSDAFTIRWTTLGDLLYGYQNKVCEAVDMIVAVFKKVKKSRRGHFPRFRVLLVFCGAQLKLSLTVQQRLYKIAFPS